MNWKFVRSIAGYSALTLILGSQQAHASMVGYVLTIEPGTESNASNVPQFEIANFSSSSSITNFQFTIGDINNNFDAYYKVSAPFGAVGYSFDGLDTNGIGGVNSELININFNNFVPYHIFCFEIDIDKDDSVWEGPSFSSVFWNNGVASNSRITVTFSDGSILTQEIEENPIPYDDSSFVFYQLPVVPAPSTILLLGSSLTCLAGIASRRRSLKVTQ